MRTAKNEKEQGLLDRVRKVPVNPDPDSFEYQHHCGAWMTLRYDYGWSVDELAEQMEDAMKVNKEMNA